MLGLRTHIVRTSDIQVVSDWYTQLFETTPYFSNENYIGYDVAGFEFGIIYNPNFKS